jgi:acyl carrier protein
MNLLQEINDIFKDVLDDESIVINRGTTSDDVEEWDSLNHIRLIVAIEKKYRLKFTAAQMMAWKNVGEMCDDIEKMLA